MTLSSVKTQEEERLGIQSVEIAAVILRALADGGGLMQLRELAAATGMHLGLSVDEIVAGLDRCGVERACAFTLAKLSGETVRQVSVCRCRNQSAGPRKAAISLGSESKRLSRRPTAPPPGFNSTNSDAGERSKR